MDDTDWRKEARQDAEDANLDSTVRALDLLDELEAWLKGIPCQGCRTWGSEGVVGEAYPKTCQACGGEGTELARFQRKKKPSQESLDKSVPLCSGLDHYPMKDETCHCLGIALALDEQQSYWMDVVAGMNRAQTVRENHAITSSSCEINHDSTEEIFFSQSLIFFNLYFSGVVINLISIVTSRKFDLRLSIRLPFI